MTAATPTKQKTTRIKMLKSMRVAKPESVVDLYDAVEGQELDVTLDVGHGLVRDKAAEWIDQPPQLDKQTEALVAQAARHARALKSFTPGKTEGPGLRFSLHIPIDDKLMRVNVAALLLDLNKYERMHGYEAFDQELLPQYRPSSETPVNEYLANPQSVELVNPLAQIVVEAWQGGYNPGIRFSRLAGEALLRLSTPYGGNPAMILTPDEMFDSALRTGATVGRLAGGWNDPYVELVIKMIQEWGEAAHRAAA